MREVSLGPWSKGINNQAAAHLLPRGTRQAPGDSCLDALNLDFDKQGWADRRSGYGAATVVTNGRSLSLQGSKVMFASNTTLGVLASMSPYTLVPLRTGVSLLPFSYAEQDGEVWWSNGAESGRCNADNTDSPWAVPTPSDIPLVAASAGALPAGAYRVAITHEMASGEESGASAVYAYDLATAGALVVTLPAAKAGTTSFTIYCTETNGDVLQRYSTVAAATASVAITSAPTGRLLGDREFLSPLPAGDILAFFNGRLLSAKGTVLSYSEAHEFGLYCVDENYIDIGAPISIVAPCENGVFVGAGDRTFWYEGTDIKTATPIERLPFGAVKGTAFQHPDSKTVGWFSANGFVLGGADGSVTLPQQDRGFAAPQATTGASLVRRIDGETHLVCNLDAGAVFDSEVSTDFASVLSRHSGAANCVVMNLDNGATSRYSNWSFNSFAKIGGRYYGCEASGLRLLEGDDDAGAGIAAALCLGRVGFESQYVKAPQAIYVAGSSSDAMVIDITMPDGAVYDFPARTSSLTPRVHRHGGMRGLMRARESWFDVMLRNQNGSSLSVSGVRALVADSTRRI